MAMRQERLDNKLNPWLGKHKDERVKVIGLPENCHALSQGGEACMWRFRGVSGGGPYGGSYVQSWEDRVIFVYNSLGRPTDRD